MTKTSKKPAALKPITAEAFAAAKLAADAATKAAQTKRAAPMAIKVETMKSNIVEPPKPEAKIAKTLSERDVKKVEAARRAKENEKPTGSKTLADVAKPRKAKAAPKGIPNAPKEIDLDGPDPRPASLKREEPKAEVVEAPKAKTTKSKAAQKRDNAIFAKLEADNAKKAPALKPDKGALAQYVAAIEAKHGAGHAGLTTSEAEATAALVARYKIEAGRHGNAKHFLVKKTQAGNWYWGPVFAKAAPEELPPTGWKREDDYADAKVAKKVKAATKRTANAVKREAKKTAPKKERTGPTKNEIMLKMVARKNGATEAEICEHIGWKACLVTLKRAAEAAGVKLRVEREPGQKGRYFVA